MRKAIAVAVVTLWSMCLMAQANQQADQSKIPETCAERNVLKDQNGNIVLLTHEQMKARATKRVKPKRPPFAGPTSRIRGAVYLNLIVGPDGKPECIRVISGHPMLYSGAIDAAREWKFKPMRSKGRPIAFAGVLQIVYVEHG